MDIKRLLKELVERNGSDLFCRAGGFPRMRVDGQVIALGEQILSLADIEDLTQQLTTPQQRERFKESLDIDFAIFLEELGRRFRVSIFQQRNSPSIVIRNIRSDIQTFEELHLPAEVLRNLAMETRGLVLLTGSMGSGKSTTLASMIEYINANCHKHILTVEEPIEFTFRDKKSLINQRELGIDVFSYSVALRAFTLQSPDVIYIANIRDLDTMSAALMAAETGVLVLSTLHSINASQTIERIVNFFPLHQQPQIRVQLSLLLKGVISLRLVSMPQGGRIPACEIMLLTPTISRLIREGKIWEIPQFIEDGGIYGMQSFNQALIKLIEEGKLTEDEAVKFSYNAEEFRLALRGFKKK